MPMDVSNKTLQDIILRRVRDLPSIPDMVDKIVAKLAQPDTNAAEIARLISYDPGLTSKVLRIVNSAAYGFQRQISSVQHAIMILGFNQVRGMVLSASLVKLFGNGKSHGLDPDSFWKHSIQTGIASRVLANHWHIPYAEDAFSAGILHDIGKITLDTYFGQEYRNVVEAARQQRLLPHGDAFLALEKQLISLDHTEIGYQLALRWRLPETFKAVIRYHHAPEQAEEAVDLVFVVALANAFSKMCQYNHGVFTPDWIPPAVQEHFSFDPEDPGKLESLFHYIADEISDTDDLQRMLKTP